MRGYVVFCSEHLDGLAAAAIVFRYAHLRNQPCKLGGFLNYATIDEDLQQLATVKDAMLFVLDFSPEQASRLAQTLEVVKKHGTIAYWNSHHAVNPETMELLKANVRILDFAPPEAKQCSAELAAMRLLPQDAVAKTLAAMAHDLEFWEQKNEQATLLADVIASGFEKQELIDLFSRGVFWSPKLEEVRSNYLQRKAKALDDLRKRLVIKNYVGKNFGITLAENILSSADAGQAVLETGVDVSVVLYRSGRISFRRKDTVDINLRELAKHFSGGGHPYAAGGMFTDVKTISVEQWQNVLFALDRKFKDFFLR